MPITAYYFSAQVASQHKTSLPKPKFWQRRILVIECENCIHEQIPLGNVPFWHRYSFAQLQAKSKSAFSRTGWAALVQGNTLDIWMWDASLEEACAQVIGRPYSVIPSSLLGVKQKDGLHWVSDIQGSGVEMRLWRNSQLIATHWFDGLPSAEQWELWLAQKTDLAAQALPPQIMQTLRPARAELAKWVNPILPKPKRDAAWMQLANTRRWGLALASLAVVAWLGLLLGQQAYLKEQIAKADLQRNKKLSDFEASNSERQKAQQRLTWLEAVSRFERKTPMYQYLDAMAIVIDRLGLTVRSVEIGGGTAGVTVSVPAGSAFRITSVVNALEQHPLFYDVKFVDVEGGDGFKFTWRLESSHVPSVSIELGGKP